MQITHTNPGSYKVSPGPKRYFMYLFIAIMAIFPAIGNAEFLVWISK